MLAHERQAERSFFWGVVSSVGLTVVVAILVLIVDLVTVLVFEWSGAAGPVWMAGYLLIPVFAGGIFGYDWSRGQRRIGISGGAISAGVSIVIYYALEFARAALQMRVRVQFDYTWGFFVEYAVLSLVFLLPLASLLGAGAGLFFSRFPSRSSKLPLSQVSVAQTSVAERTPIPGTARLPRTTIGLFLFGMAIVSLGIWSSNVAIALFGLLISFVPLVRTGPRLAEMMRDSGDLRLAQATVIDRKMVKAGGFYSSGSLSLLVIDLLFYAITLIRRVIRPSYSYSLVLEFSVPLHGGLADAFKLKANVTKALYESSSIGRAVSILYDESDPTRLVLEGESEYARFRSEASD